MKTLLALSAVGAALMAAAPAAAHGCGCQVRHRATAHFAVRHVSRASIPRVVVVREPVYIRERVVVREPVYVRERPAPVVVRERIFRPAPYSAPFYAGVYPIRYGYERREWGGGREWGRRDWDHRGQGWERDGWRDHSRFDRHEGDEHGWRGGEGHGEHHGGHWR